MEVDSLIERHRQRVLEHKRFLASNECLDAPYQRNDSSNSTNNIPTNTNAPSSGRSREELITQSLSRALNAAERGSSGRSQLALESDMMNIDDATATTTAANSNRIPSASTAMFFGYAGEEEQSLVEDRLLEQHLNAAGKYYVKGPSDSMYQRSVWWLTNREKQRRMQQESLQDMELTECTFQPTTTVLKTSRSKSGTSQDALAPNNGGGKSRGGASTSTPQGGVKRSVSPADVAAVSHHLLRQQHARQLKDDAKRRMEGPDISNWTPRQTVARGPELGKRSIPIASLRQPVWGRTLFEQGDDEYRQEEHTNEDSDSRRHRRGEEEEGGGGGGPEVNQNDTGMGSDESYLPSRLELVSIVAELRQNLAMKDKEQAVLKQRVSEQDGVIQSLRRELDIAKGMVRRLTLQGTATSSS